MTASTPRPAETVDPRQLAEPEVNNHSILISGGELTIISGDGMDANGDLLISGGVIRISGPESGEDGALDADGKMAISGGSLMAFGAAAEAEMPQGVGQTSSLIVLENRVPARQEVQVKTRRGRRFCPSPRCMAGTAWRCLTRLSSKVSLIRLKRAGKNWRILPRAHPGPDVLQWAHYLKGRKP